MQGSDVSRGGNCTAGGGNAADRGGSVQDSGASGHQLRHVQGESSALLCEDPSLCLDAWIRSDDAVSKDER